MALEEVFVDLHVLDSDDALLAFHFFDRVHQQKWITMRQDLLDPDTVENHGFASDGIASTRNGPLAVHTLRQAAIWSLRNLTILYETVTGWNRAGLLGARSTC
jgi:hypothetical protein